MQVEIEFIASYKGCLDHRRQTLTVIFRCNAWKRTRCNFQMYALYTKDNKIFLYEGGEHDHTGIRVPNIADSPERDDGYQEISVMNQNGPHELGMVKNEPCSSQSE